MVVLSEAPKLESDQTPTRIYLVRHGETDYNKQKRLQGHTDIPLNHAGRAQAEDAKARWHGVPLAAGYSSDLMRARETLELLVAERDLPLQEDARLREQGYGKYEGLLYSEFQEQATPDDEEIEGTHLLLARHFSALEEIAKNHPASDVIVVSHGGAIRSILSHILDDKETVWRTENLCHLLLHYDSGTWSVVDMHGISR